MDISVCFGDDFRDLRPPYENLVSPWTKLKIRWRAIAENSISPISSMDNELTDILDGLSRKDNPQIEIFGIWENLCVLDAAYGALSRGIFVAVPKGYTVKCPIGLQGTIEENLKAFYKMEPAVREDRRFLYLSPRK
jgi:hypothetical protein